MSKQIPWLRVFVEGVVIVASILLAFGLQAWWDGVQEREEEGRILAALAEDFAATRANTLDRIALTEEVRDTVMRLLELGSMEQTPVGSEELRHLVRGAWGWYDLEPQISTYEDIASSGTLRLIRSERLRIAMAQLVKDLEDAHSAAGTIRQRWTSMEEPYLVRHFAYAEIFWDYRDVGLPKGSFRADPDAFTDREFANILAGRAVAFQDFIFKARDVLDDLEVVLELIDNETAR